MRVYQWDSGSSSWTQQGSDIGGEAAGDQFGYSVAMSSDGSILAIGARYNDGNATYAGHVRVYEWDSGSGLWTQLGTDIDGEAADDQSGWSVALSSNGHILAVGAFWNDGTHVDTGHVRVYEWN